MSPDTHESVKRHDLFDNNEFNYIAAMTDKTKKPRPVVLCILDGWGERAERENNAIALAETPVWDRLRSTCPHAQLDASEDHVGLPAGQMGNSEVGHMNIGAGRVVMQDLPRIDAALADGTLARNVRLLKFVNVTKNGTGTVHLMGLMSPGGVHSHQDHIAGLANILADEGLDVVVHAILDGRDTPPTSAAGYVEAFEKAAPRAKIGTVIGRFFAMDRDKNWDRVGKAYAAMVSAAGERAGTAADAIEQAYARGETDEFVAPTVIGDFGGMMSGDGLLMANFRADRAREILSMLADPTFEAAARDNTVTFCDAVGLTSYSDAHDKIMGVLFPSLDLEDVLGQVVANAGLKQLRIAETEKYAHVTFFFNGGREDEFTGEDRILIPSPKVQTYDLKPSMSAVEVTDELVRVIDGQLYDLIVVNFANTDMVGHTGILSAAIEAVETVDACLGRLDAAVQKAGGAMIITADHGNAEKMVDPDSGQAHTAHTRNLVPIIAAGAAVRDMRVVKGKLADIAPTLLQLLQLPVPAAMTGQSLLVENETTRAAE